MQGERQLIRELGGEANQESASIQDEWESWRLTENILKNDSDPKNGVL
jgi:hypothetical protein